VEPTPKSLILDLLSTLRGRPMPVRALVAAAEVFGIPQNNLRVALARLRSARQVERDERGSYRIGDAARVVHDRVSAWRAAPQRLRRFDGRFAGVHTAGLSRSDRAALRRRTRALRFLGFRELSPGLSVRPDNLAGGVAAMRGQLRQLGLEPSAPVFQLRDLDAETDARARALWDTRALRAGYRASITALEKSARRLSQRPEREAMLESFLLGGRAIRQIVFDPLLPEAILPGDGLRELVEVMRRYDALGRECWSGFMRAFGAIPERHTPVNVGAFASALAAGAEA
jgi:phenylacetic acid degradation operon negative regulatory protein